MAPPLAQNDDVFLEEEAEEEEREETTRGQGSGTGTNRQDCLPDCTGNREQIFFSIEGWRRRCIFVLLAFLIVLVCTNLALTLWILSVMKLHKDGMGPLKITSGGVQLKGTAVFLDSLVASSIRSREMGAVSIDSADNFTVRTTDRDGNVDNRMFVDKDVFELSAKNFVIRDSEDNLLFSSNSEEVVVAANNFKLISEAGVIFEKSISTKAIISEPGDNLTLKSPTRSLLMEAAENMTMDSESIEASSMKDFVIKSREKAIVLDASVIQMKNLQISIPGIYDVTNNRKLRNNKFYQLCMCSNGRLFMADPDGLCQTYVSNEHICM